MECNKDEAIRVTGIAELKFSKKDLSGAKKFILKALRLYSCLDSAIQLSAVLDVHIAALVKVGISEPEPDYYGILQVKPHSDDSTIKQQYRNLSKLVHPDKNKKSMKEESEAAFKLISKAFEVLSDEETRFQHDSKRGGKPSAKEPQKPTYSTHQPQQRDVKWGGMPRANPQPQSKPRKQEPPKATYSANQPRHQGAAQPTPATGAQASQAPHPFWTPASPASGAQASQAPNTFWTPESPAPGAQASQAPNAFWTACPICRMQYQCMSIFLNYQVVCQKCHSSFPANDINAHPANGTSAFVWPPGPSGNNNPFVPANGASAFVWPSVPPGNSNPFLPANGASAFVWPPAPLGNNNPFLPADGASEFAWPPAPSGNNNPFLAGTNWYEMFQNHLAPTFGASTNGTSWNDLFSVFSGANPSGDYGNNPSPAQFSLSMLLSAMNLS